MPSGAIVLAQRRGQRELADRTWLLSRQAADQSTSATRCGANRSRRPSWRNQNCCIECQWSVCRR